MGLSYTTADSSLKEDYEGPAREQLNNSTVLLQQIEKNTKDIEGRRAVLSLHVSRTSGIGSRAENGTLPAAGNQGTAEERVTLKYHYARIQISGPVIEAMKSDRGSFVRAVDSEMKGAINDLKRNYSRQIFGTSDGVIVKVANVTSATVTFHSGATLNQKRQIEVGMSLDIGTSTPFTSVSTGNIVTGINFDTDGVTPLSFILTSSVTTSNGDSVVVSGSGGSGSAQKEITGIQSIIAASGSLFNVDPATYPVWRSLVLANGGTPRPASETLFAQACQVSSINGGGNAKLLVTSDGVHRNFAAQLQTEKRFSNTLDLKGGYKAISITAGGMDEIGLIWDRDCVYDAAFGIDLDEIAEYQSCDWEWMDKDGAVLSRVSGVDAYEATMRKYSELATPKRNAHFRVSDLQTS